jgi:hypothetical protein
MLGGGNIRMADPGAASIRWQLRYTNLSDAEWSTIQQLFESAEGRLNPFTFLDPTANLLMWSEDWTQSAWSADPLLQVAGAAEDPFGESNAIQLTNQAQTTQRVMQTTSGSSSFQYCFSLSVRSDVPLTAQLVITASGQELVKTITTDTAWHRVSFAGALETTADNVSFGVQLAAGTRLDVFGAQAEAQPAAGHYKKTLDRGGVYTSTRFDSDALTRQSEGANQNSCVVELLSNLV